MGLEKMVWHLIIKDNPKGSGRSLESFREGRDTLLIQDPCLAMAEHVLERRETLAAERPEEAGRVVQKSSVEAWARATTMWSTD